MKKITVKWILLFIVLAALLVPVSLAGCDCGGPDAGALELGDAVAVAEAEIGPGGGSIIIEEPGEPLDGLALEVPAGAYDDDTDFTVSYAPITGHSLGENFNPVSPLITVENGGGYAEELITVKIPVEVPEDHFAMGFYYDEETGRLEGLPLLARDEDSVTVATRHFSAIAVASVNINLLVSGEIDTGFRPGVDDWQFTNRGSYIAPEGHCAGQSISAMWYYYEKRLSGAASLYGFYDNNKNVYQGRKATPGLWQDDSLGYRFASTVQQDIDWAEFAAKLTEKLTTLRITEAGKLTTTGDELTRYAFAYSMLLTGEPQLVCIYDTVNGGGHALAAYKITADGAIYLADPNYPGETSRKVEYANGAFKPYDSAARAGAPGTKYDLIAYVAKTALVPWDKVTARWQEFADKTIGDDMFPAYTVYWEDDEGEKRPVGDGFSTERQRVKIWVESAAYGLDNVGWAVYRGEDKLDFDANNMFLIGDGPAALGIAVFGDVRGSWEYIDFRHFSVNEGAAEPEETGEAPAGETLIVKGYIPADQFDAEVDYHTSNIMLHIDTGSGQVEGGCTIEFVESIADIGPVLVNLDGSLEGAYTAGEDGQYDLLEGSYEASVDISEAFGEYLTTEYLYGSWVAEIDEFGSLRGAFVGTQELLGYELRFEGEVQ